MFIFAGIFRSCSFFMAANVRKAVAEGRSDCVPIFLSEIPLLFHRKIIKPDVAFIQVSIIIIFKYLCLQMEVSCVSNLLMLCSPKLPICRDFTLKINQNFTCSTVFFIYNSAFSVRKMQQLRVLYQQITCLLACLLLSYLIMLAKWKVTI
jgi:hypothetical protein